MNLKEQIESYLKNLQDLEEAVSKVTNSEDLDDDQKAELLGVFKCTLETALSELKFDSEDLILLSATELSGGTLECATVEPMLFKQAQEIVAVFNPEWNTSSAKLALELYIAAGGVLSAVDEDANVTFGQLYGLGSEDSLFSVEAPMSTTKRKALPDSVFCGPNRSFPVNDRAHAVAAMKLIGRYKGPGDKKAIMSCIHKKAAKFGVGPNAKKEGAICLFPLYVEGVNGKESISQLAVDSQETLTELKSQLPELLVHYGREASEADKFTELFESFERFLPFISGEDTEFDPNSLFATEDSNAEAFALGYEFLYDFFNQETESTKVDYLQSLVGVVRKLNLSQEEIEEASKSYAIFSPTILKRLLSAIPAEKPEEHIEQNINPGFSISPTQTEVESKKEDPKTVSEQLRHYKAQKRKVKGAANSKEYKN